MSRELARRGYRAVSLFCPCSRVAVRILQGAPVCAECLRIEQWLHRENLKRGPMLARDRRLAEARETELTG